MKPSELALALAAQADLAAGSAKRRRIESGVSQSDVARALGVSHQRVSGWESGRHAPSAEHALAYRKLLLALTRAVSGRVP